MTFSRGSISDYPKLLLISDCGMHSIWILDLPVLTALRVNFPSASSEVIFCHIFWLAKEAELRSTSSSHYN